MSQNTSEFLQGIHLNKTVSSGDSQITILQDINLAISKGESIAILGASGSGKTTLLSLLAGLDIPTSGDIHFYGEILNKLNEDQRAQLRGQYIGFIFQSFQLLPTMTALENVMLPLEIQLNSHQKAKASALHWLERVGLAERLHHYPAQLSGGEQQRVAIARAFVNQPQIVFGDEVTGNLDTQTGEHITDILFELNKQQNTTLVLVTHDESLALRCDRRLLLNKGILQPC